MSLEDPEDIEDPDDIEDTGYTGGWCITAVIGVETPEGECTLDPSFSVDFSYPAKPTRDQIIGDLLNAAAPWASGFFNSPGFKKRFGDNPPLCIVGSSLYHC